MLTFLRGCVGCVVMCVDLDYKASTLASGGGGGVADICLTSVGCGEEDLDISMGVSGVPGLKE